MNSELVTRILLLIFGLNLILGLTSIGMNILDSKGKFEIVWTLFGSFLLISFVSIIILLIGCFIDVGTSIVFSNLATLIVGETVILTIMAMFVEWQLQLKKQAVPLRKKKKLKRRINQ
ncbi:hypothetical protein ACWOFR_11410 [Carnobacterium gallinarum]|uniref:hypothetical protein n=1 Tax=Carnobacterium gallinarum TaxID=2749 RepID=UPI0005521E1E|nr:hypothetical protein [Carnobacterium gallinarum]